MLLETTTNDAFSRIIDELQYPSETGSRAGKTKELRGVKIVSDNPRARLLHRPGINWAFGLQECYAYWNGLNPGRVTRYNTQMEEYLYENDEDDGEVLHGSAYGRYFRDLPHDQIERALDQITENPDTRRAVINVHNAFVEDYDGPDVACTISLHPMLRDNELHLFVEMRSQDMLWGYPYDVQAFQWIQEVMAGILNSRLDVDVDVGEYHHHMHSCHYYLDYEDQVIEAKEQASGSVLPDCRLPEDSVEEAMRVMHVGLWSARHGRIPHHFIHRLEELNTFYADWIRTMVVYELREFYDEPADDVLDDITTSGFRQYL